MTDQPDSTPPKALWRAAAIITLVLPVGVIVVCVYAMLAGIDNPALQKWGDLSLGFVFATLANRIWDA